MHRKIIISLSLITLFIHNSFSTPERGFTTREIFIGANDSFFVSVTNKRTQPGTYYEFSDSTFICSYFLDTSKMIEKTLIKVVHYQNQYAAGNWVETEKLKKDIYATNVFLDKYDVALSYPSKYLSKENITKEELGLVGTNSDGKQVFILNKEIINEIFSIENHLEIKVLEIYETNSHFFLQLQRDVDNGHYFQKIISVTKNDF